MSIDKLTLEVAKELVDKAIALRGEDYEYQRGHKSDCMYVHHDEVWDDVREDYVPVANGKQPGCLVGMALNLHGVPLEAMQEMEGDDANALIEYLKDKGILEYEDRAAEYLYYNQVAQDRGETWGFAKQEAEGKLAQAYPSE